MLVFEERGNRSTQRKTSRSKDENEQQTQPTYDAESGNQARATLVRGECSHHCTIPAPPLGKLKWHPNVWANTREAKTPDIDLMTSAECHLEPSLTWCFRMTLTSVKPIGGCLLASSCMAFFQALTVNSFWWRFQD